MIGKVIRGDRADGLLRYLYGPGADEEHRDPHLVASWSGQEDDPARVGESELRRLAALLEQPVRVLEHERGRRVNDPVWHYPVRAAPTDRLLSDGQWADIARRIVAAAGIAQPGDIGACRWIAVRHAEDHIHIVATLARVDGAPFDHHNDALRVRAEILRIEREYGLRPTAPADRTARRPPSRKELGKARRLGMDVPVREALQRHVRDAAIAARSEREFFALLEAKGLRVRQNLNSTGDIVGYAVAMPGDRNATGEPIWYSGAKLAPDLSLPRVRARIREHAQAVAARKPSGHAGTAASPEQHAQAWERAAAAVHQAARVLPGADDADGAAILAALTDMLSAAAERAPATVRPQLQAAARAFERAGLAPKFERHARQAAADLRIAAQGLTAAGRALASGRDAAAVFVFIASAIAATVAAYHWYRARGWNLQAEAAQLANAHLRTALGLKTVNDSPAAPYDSEAAHRPQLRDAVRAALGGRAEEVLNDPAWPALAAVLRQAEQAGHPAATVLAEVAAERSLRDADSVAAVLTWRVQRWLTRTASSDSTTDTAADQQIVQPRAEQGQPTAGERHSTAAQPPENAPERHDKPNESAVQRDERSDDPAARPERLIQAAVRYAQAVRAVAGRDADAVLNDPAWTVLIGVLQDAEAAGYTAEHVLSQATRAAQGHQEGQQRKEQSGQGEEGQKQAQAGVPQSAAAVLAWGVRQYLTSAQQQRPKPPPPTPPSAQRHQRSARSPSRGPSRRGR
ncbi:relaxase/mobilization nuclease domain-containing protein [Actinomadura keratinilytica]|jgi:hypothetical protein|uniref:Relaxase/mobilization nuclease domain-containing protein n=1 Tax=Actinomadura keratinilytica TaxID=547461 RepID=A0ABP7ZFV3_9ACTN